MTEKISADFEETYFKDEQLAFSVLFELLIEKSLSADQLAEILLEFVKKNNKQLYRAKSPLIQLFVYRNLPDEVLVVALNHEINPYRQKEWGDLERQVWEAIVNGLRFFVLSRARELIIPDIKSMVLLGKTTYIAFPAQQFIEKRVRERVLDMEDLIFLQSKLPKLDNKKWWKRMEETVVEVREEHLSNND